MRGRDLARYLLEPLALSNVFADMSIGAVTDTIVARIAMALQSGKLSESDANALSAEWMGFRSAVGKCTSPLRWLFQERSASDGCEETLWDILTTYPFPVTSGLGLQVPFVSSYLERGLSKGAIDGVLDPVNDLRGLTYNSLHTTPKNQKHMSAMSRARAAGVFGAPPTGLSTSLAEGDDPKGNSLGCNCETNTQCVEVSDPESFCYCIDGVCAAISDCA